MNIVIIDEQEVPAAGYRDRELPLRVTPTAGCGTLDESDSGMPGNDWSAAGWRPSVTTRTSVSESSRSSRRSVRSRDVQPNVATMTENVRSEIKTPYHLSANLRNPTTFRDDREDHEQFAVQGGSPQPQR